VTSSTARQPTIYLPHGGGPCFFMEWTLGPRDTWKRMAEWLRSVPGSLPAPPSALLVVSGHWEAPVPTVTSSAAPPLLYDYSGFPPSTYELTWPAPGSPGLAARVQELLGAAGIDTRADPQRGFDHGVFIPLKVAYPAPHTPTVQLSLRAGLDPLEHLAIGRALAPLRHEGVLLVGSGMSYHNMRGFMAPGTRDVSARFDEWLAAAVSAEPPERDAALGQWSRAPMARQSHPREEHLLPLMVVAGAAGADRGKQVLRDEVMGAVVSAFRFD
jgi:aromatic ring-opening dioxygenase catalytic subunit (LigB family)